MIEYQNKLHELRTNNKWTTQYVADYLNISKEKYVKIENGIIFPNFSLVSPLEKIFDRSFINIMQNPITGIMKFFTEAEVKDGIYTLGDLDGITTQDGQQVTINSQDELVLREKVESSLTEDRELKYSYLNLFENEINSLYILLDLFKSEQNYHYEFDNTYGVDLIEVNKNSDGHFYHKYMSAAIFPEWATTPAFFNDDNISQMQFENYYRDRKIPLPENKFNVDPKLFFIYSELELDATEGEVINVSPKFVDFDEALGEFANYHKTLEEEK
ncbi:MAG: helix-turn-helix transcriptional regulator [Bacteroides sp.]|nr:helix-turn-helix transcriptional regulator [Bacteroides sp.]